MEEVLTDRDACEDLCGRMRHFKEALCGLFSCDVCPMRSHRTEENPCVLTEPISRLYQMRLVYAKGDAGKRREESEEE